VGGSVQVLETALFGIPLLKVTGDVDHLSSVTLEKYVQESLHADGLHLLVDLAECEYMDSGGVSVLLYAALEVRAKGWIGLIAPSPNLLRVFEITGLTVNPDVRLFADIKEAADALEGYVEDA
jgi:anti-anti-sigma factor